MITTIPAICLHQTFNFFHSVSLFNRVSQIALDYFSFMQYAGMGLFGLKELVIDTLPRIVCGDSEFRIEDVAEHALEHIKGIFQVSERHTCCHGALYLGSGIFGGVAALGELRWINLHWGLPFMNFLGTGLFFFVSFYSLDEHLTMYQHAEELLDDPKESVREFAKRTQWSCMMGILNNLGYIAATIFSLFSGTLAIAVILGVFAVFVGCIKFVYDIFYLNSQPQQDFI